MTKAVFKQLDNPDIHSRLRLFTNYTPSEKADHKIKKGEGGIASLMERTVDILAELGKRKKNQILV